MCGMYPARSARWQTQILFRDGGYRAFDGCKDMFKYLSEMTEYEKQYRTDDIAAIYVKDFGNGKWIDAKKAYFVIDSKLSGPMGKDFIPFEDHAQAVKMATASDGRVADYSQINSDMVQSAEIMREAKTHMHD